MSKAQAKRYHGERIGTFTRTRLIDLNRIDLEALTSSDLFSHVLVLPRDDADLHLFLAVLHRINEESGSMDQSDRLKKAMIAAAAGRYEILKVLKEVTVDHPQIRESFDLLFEADYARRMKSFFLAQVEKTPDAPSGVAEMIENCDFREIEVIGDQLLDAIRSNDWTKFKLISFRA